MHSLHLGLVAATRRLKTGSLPVAATNVLILLCGMSSGILVSRALGPDGRGEYVAWHALAAVAGSAAFVGCPQLVVLLGRAGWRVGRSELLAAVAAATCLASIVTTVALYRSASVAVLIGGILVVASTQLGSLGPSLAQREGRMAWDFNAARMMPQLGGLLAVAILALTPSRSSATWLVIVASFQAVGTLWWVWRHAPSGCSDITQSVRRLAGGAVKLGPFTWISLLQYKGDIVLAGLLLPASVVGYYAVGLSAQAAVFAIGSAGGMHWFSSTDDMARNFRREITKSLGLATLAGLALATTAPFWVPTLYGPAFAPAIPLVALLCAVGVLQTADYFVTHEGLLGGVGPRIALLRLPGVLLLLATAFLTADAAAARYVLAVAAGVSFAVSGLLIHLFAQRSRQCHLPTAAVLLSDGR